MKIDDRRMIEEIDENVMQHKFNKHVLRYLKMENDLNLIVDKLERLTLKIEGLKYSIFNSPGGADNARIDDLQALAAAGKELARLQTLLNAAHDHLTGGNDENI